MIILFNPRATKPRSRRFPLSVLAIAAVLEGGEEYAIVDGNLDPRPTETIEALIRAHPIELLAVSVMPGPQMVATLDPCRQIRSRFPQIPIVWGGYFPSNYTDAALNAAYVDFAVRGQGEETFLELVEAIRGKRSLAGVAGLSYKDDGGKHHHSPARAMKSLDAFPWYPYHRIPAQEYLRPTFLGRRTGVHQASLGCPYGCTFCGVVPMYGSREKMESAARTEAILRHLASTYGMDSVQFYDNNFFVREDHARELAERIAPLGLRWWCESRIDALLRYSDATLEAIRRAGATMIFFGAESGSDWVLKEMHKALKAEQTIELAKRIRAFGITPEFSFVIGNPKDPERDTRECLQFIRNLKHVNPEAEIIINHYTPVPQRERIYKGADSEIAYPTTPEEWATDRWLKFSKYEASSMPWLKEQTRRRIDNFRLVVSSRWPTAQDIRLPAWGRKLLQALSRWRYALRVYSFPFELRLAQWMVSLRKPQKESL